MNTRPALWSLLLIATVVLAACGKQPENNDTLQPGATAPSSTAAMPPATPPATEMPPPASTAAMPPSTMTSGAPASSSTASPY